MHGAQRTLLNGAEGGSCWEFKIVYHQACSAGCHRCLRQSMELQVQLTPITQGTAGHSSSATALLAKLGLQPGGTRLPGPGDLSDGHCQSLYKRVGCCNIPPESLTVCCCCPQGLLCAASVTPSSAVLAALQHAPQEEAYIQLALQHEPEPDEGSGR